jgi:radical SAM superfamily enzyme YgiQ (UPF0313 family)
MFTELIKGADILLVYPPHRKITFVSSIPHLSAYAKKKGFKVDCLDVPTLKLSIQDVIEYVKLTDPRSVGISIPFTPLASKGLELIKELKKHFPNMPLIVGGIHPSICPDEFKKYATVCIGDGERALISFLENMERNKMWGLETPILKIKTPITEVEAPDWKAVEYEKYQLVLPTGETCFPIQTSRGCPFDCIFCSSRFLFEGKIFQKTMAQVDKEIQDGIKLFNSKCIVFRCENFTINKKWFIELCSYLKQNKIMWWAQTNANLINEEFARIAKNSGCRGFSIGIETADSFIMKKIKKGITLDQGRRAFKILKNAGLCSAVNFIIGHPWDTVETVQKIIDYADEVDPDYFGLQIATPFPGTEFRKIVIEQGIELKENWSNYLTSMKDNYTPLGLIGFDLTKIRDKVEWKWFIRKPSRFLNILRDKRSLKSKLRFVRRMIQLWKSQRGFEFDSSLC